MIQDRVAIVIMSGGKDSRIGVPRATLPMFFSCGMLLRRSGKEQEICQIWCLVY